MMTSKISKTIYTLLAIFFIMSVANAQVTAYNNFGQGNEGWDYNWGLGWTIAGTNVGSQYYVEQAMAFESTVDGYVSDVWVAISYVPLSSPADTVIIRLAENPNGLPPDSAYIMEEWMLTEFDSWSQWNTPIHLEGNGNSYLEEGKSYWLWAYAVETTWTMWCMNEDPSFTCPHTIRHENEPWFPISNETASAFRVDVGDGTGISLNKNDQHSVLLQNYPNPFSGQTKIEYFLGKPSLVNLSIYDTFGRKIQNLVNERKEGGRYVFDFKAEGLPAGIYMLRLFTDDSLAGVRKMSYQP